MNKKQKKLLYRILGAAAGMVLLACLPLEGIVGFMGHMIPYLIIGHDIIAKAWHGIKNKQIFDENFLMTVATMGAIAIALLGRGDYVEAIAVMLFYQVGELFQSYAVGKSRKSISELMDIRPDYANMEVEGHLEKVDPEEIEVGTIIIVQPGEKVPIDGRITEGCSSLNTAALTGESIPKDVKPGDEVLSGSINLSGVLRVETTKEFGESTVSQILELVENASSNKSKSEDFIAKFARVYTPVVCYAALALAVLPPLFRMLLLQQPGEWLDWMYRALTFLVISCPCALVVSIPLSFFAGIGGAGREGILIKGSNYLETLSKVKCVVFDKTGTLTQGVFEVTDIVSETLPKEKLLEYAALAESASSHPISKSIRRAYGREIDRSRVSELEELSGKGVTAKVDGVSVVIGNGKLLQHRNLKPVHREGGGTQLHIAVDGQYAGYLVIADLVKPQSKEAISRLKKTGISKLVMLTGDAAQAAGEVAASLGIQEVYSELLPVDKVAHVEALISKRKPSEKLAFVGDGINDAPVLSLADIGIAMGAIGSDAAIEAADVVLMDDNPGKIAEAIRISRKCIGIVYQNTVFSIGVKVLCLLLSAVGIGNMWYAIFADVGVTVLAVLNAIRALEIKNPLTNYSRKY